MIKHKLYTRRTTLLSTKKKIKVTDHIQVTKHGFCFTTIWFIIKCYISKVKHKINYNNITTQFIY